MISTLHNPTAVGVMQLVECRGDQQQPRRINLDRLPLSIGRATESNLCLPSGAVSSRHAEITAHGDRLVLRDLGSRNGTFVNGHRVEEIEIAAEDIIQFANCVFRVKFRQEVVHGGTLEEGAFP